MLLSASFLRPAGLSRLTMQTRAAVPRRPRFQPGRRRQQQQYTQSAGSPSKQPRISKTEMEPEAKTKASTAASGSSPKSLWQRLGPLRRAIEAYGLAQRKRPYVTQTASMVVIFALGDVGAQQIGGREFDAVRTVRSVAIGGIFAVPQFQWFVFIARNFNYASRALSLATKVLVNQAVFTPVFNCYFFGMQALLSGETLAATADRLRRTVPRAIVNALKLWPAVMVVNLAYVPLDYRSLFAGVVAIGWQTYLSYLNRQAELRQAAAQIGTTTVAAAAGV